jgi:hypothetical protein
MSTRRRVRSPETEHRLSSLCAKQVSRPVFLQPAESPLGAQAKSLCSNACATFLEV